MQLPWKLEQIPPAVSFFENNKAQEDSELSMNQRHADMEHMVIILSLGGGG